MRRPLQKLSMLIIGIMALTCPDGSRGAANNSPLAAEWQETQSAAAGSRRSSGFRQLIPKIVYTPEGFTRLDLGDSVLDWFPVDLERNGTWDFGILFAGSPSRVGVFDPGKASWIDGPRVLPAWGRGWGATDLAGDGRVDYFYIVRDSVRRFDSRTGFDTLVFVLDLFPSEMCLWGHTLSNHLTAVFKGGLRDYLTTGGRCYWSVCDLTTGEPIKRLAGGISSVRIVSGYSDSPGGSALILHESHSTLDNTPHTGLNWYYQSLSLIDEQWNVRWQIPLPYAYEHDLTKPPWILTAVDYLSLNPNSGGRIFWLTGSAFWYWPTFHRPPIFGCVSDSGRYQWGVPVYTEPYTRYTGIVAYDLDRTGNPSLIMPLRNRGWELRSLSDGSLIRTIPGKPGADLRTGPILSASRRDMFYIADSGLYIWGASDWVFDRPDSSGAGRLPLLTATPNPFTTSVGFEITRDSGRVSLTIFNVLGQRIRNYDLHMASGARTSLRWDGRDEGGRTVPSGMYFARLTGNHDPVVKKLVLLK